MQIGQMVTIRFAQRATNGKQKKKPSPVTGTENGKDKEKVNEKTEGPTPVRDNVKHVGR